MRNLQREAERFSRLVDDLLTITRLDAGESLRPSRIELPAWLEAVAERVRDLAPDHSFCVESPALQITADPMRLEQAIWNLINNAVRHGVPGEIALFALVVPADVRHPPSSGSTQFLVSPNAT